jgi:hypothetical protein
MNGKLLKQGNEQDATGNETGTTQSRTKPNISGKENKGVI